MKTPNVRSLFAVPAAAAVLALTAGCSSDDATVPESIELTPTSSVDASSPTTVGDGSDSTASASTMPETPGDDGAAGSGSTTTIAPDDRDAAADPSDPRVDVLQPRVGTWVVGDAGEVDVDLTADGLELLDVRAAAGWQVSIDEDTPDEIEIDFEQGNVEWEIEIQWENGVLEIEIDQDIDPADPGVVAVGIAGSVEFDQGPDGLVLVAVDAADGWEFAVTTESADEIEVLFVNGLAEYDVGIEVDDGQIEIEVDFEVEGPFTP